MHRSPHHRSVKVASPGIGSINDGVFLLEVCQVLATDVYRPATEIARHLGTQLLEAAIAPFPRPVAVCQFVWSRHAPATVQLQSHIKLPQSQRCLIRSRQQTFILAGKGFLHQLSVVIRFGIRPTVSRGKGETREERIACLHLHYLRIGTAVKVVEQNGMRVRIHIHHHLLAEIRVMYSAFRFKVLPNKGI